MPEIVADPAPDLLTRAPVGRIIEEARYVLWMGNPDTIVLGAKETDIWTLNVITKWREIARLPHAREGLHIVIRTDDPRRPFYLVRTREDRPPAERPQPQGVQPSLF